MSVCVREREKWGLKSPSETSEKKKIHFTKSKRIYLLASSYSLASKYNFANKNPLSGFCKKQKRSLSYNFITIT